jgi:hypothetical protein
MVWFFLKAKAKALTQSSQSKSRKGRKVNADAEEDGVAA